MRTSCISDVLIITHSFRDFARCILPLVSALGTPRSSCTCTLASARIFPLTAFTPSCIHSRPHPHCSRPSCCISPSPVVRCCFYFHARVSLLSSLLSIRSAPPCICMYRPCSARCTGPSTRTTSLQIDARGFLVREPTHTCPLVCACLLRSLHPPWFLSHYGVCFDELILWLLEHPKVF